MNDINRPSAVPNGIPEIELCGSPREKGLAHGRAMRDGVRISLKTYAEKFLRDKNLPWADARSLARRFLPALGGAFEPYAEEMCGIAEGAGVDADDVLTLNLRSEILCTGLADGARTAPGSGDGECTAFAAAPPATAGGAVLAGQTWDYHPAQREASFVARFPAEAGRPAMLCVLEAGMVGGKGMNAAGLALTLNALWTHGTEIGVPLHVRMRRILEAPSFDEAVRRASEPPVPVSACLAVTHRSGRCVGLELDPEGVDAIEPADGVFVHTNHYVGRRFGPARAVDPGHGSARRLARLTGLLRGKPGLTAADAEAFLRDHENRPFGCSVCVHPRPDLPPDARAVATRTNYAFVADLAAGVLRLAMGNPCESEFVPFPLTPT